MGLGTTCDDCGQCETELVIWRTGPYDGRTFHVCPACGNSTWSRDRPGLKPPHPDFDNLSSNGDIPDSAFVEIEKAEKLIAWMDGEIAEATDYYSKD